MVVLTRRIEDEDIMDMMLESVTQHNEQHAQSNQEQLLARKETVSTSIAEYRRKKVQGWKDSVRLQHPEG